MYQNYFSLSQPPFSISTDPEFFYLSEPHREALQHLTYGIQQGGFVLLTGEVGTGKTTLSRYLLKQLTDDMEILLMQEPLSDPNTVFHQLKRWFNLQSETQDESDFATLHHHLAEKYRAGKRTILVLDEAQHLSIAVLEQLRLLTNLEENNQKLLQILLVGQPELQQLLQQNELRQFSQRITARYHLSTLNRDDTESYIRFRLQIAGSVQPIFSRKALDVIYRMSQGTPRLINLICERALLGAYSVAEGRVSGAIAAQAGYEITGKHDGGSSGSLLFFVCALLIAGVGGWFAWQQWGLQPTPIVKQVEVPVVEPPDPQQVDAFHQAIDNARDESTALTELLAAWGYDADETTPVCDSVASVQLACYRSGEPAEKMIALNYPMVIRLFDKQEGSWYAVLSAINAETATLIFDNKEWKVPADWVHARWQKGGTLIWALPKSGNHTIGKRSSTEDVRWLESALGDALSILPRAPLNRFDAILEKNLKKYQEKQGLMADGVAGEQTLIRLSQHRNISQPRLSGESPARVKPDATNTAKTGGA